MGIHVYVGNLGSSTTEETLQAAFAAKGGSVKNVVILRNPQTGRSRGFAFVELGSEDEAAAAIQAMNGVEIEGRPLKVDQARERTTRGRSFGRGFGGDSGFGGRPSGGPRRSGGGGGSRRKRR